MNQDSTQNLKDLEDDLPINSDEIINVITSRDPEDIKGIKRRDLVIVVQAIALLIISVFAFYQMLRSPDLITAVVTEDGRRVVSLNNREFGETEAIQLGKENLSNEDKRYLVTEFAKLRFGVDVASRSKDVEKMLRLMAGKSAVKYAQDLQQKQILVTERNENWQAVWNPQSVKLDANDPYRIRVIGTQKVTKNVNGQISEQDYQFELIVKLTSDGKRSDENLRTGFQIAWVDEQPIKKEANAS